MSYFWTGIVSGARVEITRSKWAFTLATPSALRSLGLSGNLSNVGRPTIARYVFVALRYASVTATIVRSGLRTRQRVGLRSKSLWKSFESTGDPHTTPKRRPCSPTRLRAGTRRARGRCWLRTRSSCRFAQSISRADRLGASSANLIESGASSSRRRCKRVLLVFFHKHARAT